MERPPVGPVAGIVLAAGRSTRMGRPNKLLLQVGGEPMVRTVARRLLDADIRPVVVVTGYDAGSVEEALEGLPVQCANNPRFRDGMGTSVAVGIFALDHGVAGALVALGDMPGVAAATPSALVEAFREARSAGPVVCVPVHGGRRGNPVLWDASFFQELRRLAGDQGGRALFGALAGAIREVEVDDPGILLDIDTPDALRRLDDGRAGGG